MTTSQMPYSQVQISAWLRGLLSVAWADSNFSKSEKDLLHELVQSPELSSNVKLDDLKPISPSELADALGKDPHIGQNFLRTAVAIAMVDGMYSQAEDDLIQQFCQALGQEIKPINDLREKIEASPNKEHHPDLLNPVREWLDRMDIRDRRLARFFCKAIPAQCPFERDVRLFGRKIIHIPAMCKINPLYDQLVGLRFRAMSYLADDCGEDVSKYC
jgi:tellurite resistance protein